MSDAIVVMKRYEMKYILTKDQVDYLVEALKGHMMVDQYGLTSVASLYFDTSSSRLIRTSIEKPQFKEKIRLRSYGLASKDSNVYLEIKRKANGIVYKRRVETKIDEVDKLFNNQDNEFASGQIANEIRRFRDYYEKLIPSCLIIYERVGYYEENGKLRLTIDYNPRYRRDNLRLDYSMDGKPLLDEGSAILEIKVQDAIPLWLSHILDEGKIYINSFSKYGKAYEELIKTAREEGNYYV